MPTYEFEMMGPSNNLLYRSIITVDRDRGIVGIGDHYLKKKAEKLAALDACYQLHAIAWAPSTQCNDRPPRGDSESKRHVVDYCARYNHLPEFSTAQIGPRYNRMWICKVDLPVQAIVAEGKGRTRRDAEQDAAADFKEKAEQWQLQNGGGAVDAGVQESGLTAATAKSFIDFYCRLRGLRPAVLRCKPTGSTSNILWKATLTANNTTIGIGTQSNKKEAEQVAYMDATIDLRKDNPDLWDKFVKEGPGSGPPPVVSLALSERTERFLDRLVKVVRRSKNLYAARERSSASPNPESSPPPARTDGPSASDARVASSNINNRAVPGYVNAFDSLFFRTKSRSLYENLRAYFVSPRMEQIREQKRALPITSYGADLLRMIETNPVSILVGSTGCGKTTQLPQIILDDWITQQKGAACNIIVTQPRRIAAISVAQRVAAERGEPLGRTVGYQVRFDNVFPKPGGSILYCTTGVFLRRMHAVKTDAHENHQHHHHHRHHATVRMDDDNRDPLQDVTHIVVDEVHERDMNTDFLLLILRRVMAERRERGLSEIRVVLMSATMDTSLFATYYGADGVGKVGKSPVMHIPGKIFPVKQWYLEDMVAEMRRTYRPSEIGRWLDHPDSVKYLERERRMAQAAPMISRRRRDGNIIEVEDVIVDAVDADTATPVFSAPVINWGGGEESGEKADAEVPYALMSLVIAYIAESTKEGAILVFLPGWEEIMALNRGLMEPSSPLPVNFNDSSRFRVHILHSSLPNLSQQEVFEPLPSPEMRKVILATNIAETSITIPDVVYVVDSGKVKEKRYDQSRYMTNLLTTWISQSNMRQRAGRAGRVREGEYFAMMSRQRERFLLDSYSTPEILRSDLQAICLHIKALDLPTSIAETLEQAIEPPDPEMVAVALENLRALQALDSSERLTPLGKVLATFPVEPGLGKMVLLGAVFRCLDPMLTIAASMTSKDPFVAPAYARREADEKKAEFARRQGGSVESDHLAVLNAYNEWYGIRSQQRHHEANRFCMNNFLSMSGLTNIERVKMQLLGLLEKAGIVPRESNGFGGGVADGNGGGAEKWALSRSGTGITAMQQQRQQQQQQGRFTIGPAEYNSNSNVFPLLRALVCSGVWPNVCIKSSKKTYQTQHELSVFIHPSSVNHRRKDDDNDAAVTGTLYAYSAKIKTSSQQVHLCNTTKMDSMAMALFGGKARLSGSGPLFIDGWLRLYSDTYVLELVDELKWVFDHALGRLWERLGEKEARPQHGPAATVRPRHLIAQEDRDTQDLLEGIVKLLVRVDEDHLAQVARGHKRDGFRANEYGATRPQSRQDGDYAAYPTSSTAYSRS
ncbi:P-loop containing nucleoside triphosphate hydrolase protein, partial [Jimgerdemannia flammicorona]